MYYAKSVNKFGKHVTCKEHLSDVAVLAEIFGHDVGLSKEAQFCGQIHDFGKYSEKFMEVLEGKITGIDHAFPGGVFLVSQLCSKQIISPVAYQSLIECVVGHHDGLQPLFRFKNLLSDAWRIERNLSPVFGLSGKQLSLQGKSEYDIAVSAYFIDFGQMQFPMLSNWIYSFDNALDKFVQQMLRTRMLFSCLVDADYSVSAEESNSGYLARQEFEFDVDAALYALSVYRSNVKRGSTSDVGLNQVRDNVYADCEIAGNSNNGLMTLTAPTGSGKTLALLNLALHKCLSNDVRPAKKRIIVVLPFLSLSDQTVAIYKQILPDVLVDNSQSDLTDEQRELASRWNASCIVTTTVQFFELLFSNKPVDCRKLHNIANSIVIFDEAQSLPLDLSRLTMYAIKELVNRYNVDVVLSTATQPAYQYMPDMTWNPVEISSCVVSNFAAVRRTELHWELEEKLSFETVANRMSICSNVCCVVNLKRHAVELYKVLQQRVGDMAFFISTDLAPLHRRKIIEQIRYRQERSLPVYVVSTQCIEAGIDMDFDELYRELAPLEAIIQAAGRCNRNGRLGIGHVYVFVPDDNKCYPDDNYAHNAMLVKLMLSNGIDINDPKSIEQYYERVYRNFTEGNESLVQALCCCDYETVSQYYKLIGNRGCQVIVPYDNTLYQEMLDAVNGNFVSKKLMRRMMPIIVSTYAKRSLVEQHCQELKLYNRRLGIDVPTGVYVLLQGHESCYDDTIGLHFEEQKGGIFI